MGYKRADCSQGFCCFLPLLHQILSLPKEPGDDDGIYVEQQPVLGPRIYRAVHLREPWV